jgi:hypothetical protein
VVYLAAFAIFLGISLTVWFVGLAVYRTYVGPEPLVNPQLAVITCVSVGLATLFSFVQYPWGYLLTVGVWWFAARHLFELPTGRAVTLFLILSALSFVGRLAVLGWLDLFVAAPPPAPASAPTPGGRSPMTARPLAPLA